jgi:transposase
VDLWSLDECHFQQHGTRTRMWVAPEIKDPVQLHASTRKSMACFGAVRLNGGQFVWSTSIKFNADEFERFLRRLLRHRRRGKRMVVVVDNAGYHHARQLQAFLRRVRHRLILLFLPPYSPQLAPIERVWKLARRLATHNHYFATLGELVAAVERCFQRWRKSNRVLHRLCGNI